MLARIDTPTAVMFAVLSLAVAVVLWRLLRLYAFARIAGAPVSLAALAGMWLHRVDAQTIVNALIMAEREGFGISAVELEAHALAGGDVQRVVGAMVIARRAKIDMTWHKASALDLAGGNALKDVLDRMPKSVA